MISITLEGLDELARDMHAAERYMGNAIEGAVRVAVGEGAEEARETHRYTDRTGTLTGSIQGLVDERSANSADGEIVATAKYASFVEDGTKSHTISPKRAGFLRFKTARGKVVFTKQVRHPGSKPYPFMGQAYTKADRVLFARLEASAEKAAKIVSR